MTKSTTITQDIEWLGGTPSSWELLPMKYVLSERKELNNPIRVNNILSLLKEVGVIPYEDKGDIGNKSKEDISKYKIAYPNDIVMNSMNVIIGSVGLSNYLGCISPVYYALYSKKHVIEFFNFLFQTTQFQKHVKKYANGLMEIRLKITPYNLFHITLPVPTKAEQKLISTFLNKKCTNIDEVIIDLNKQIAILENYKKSVITEMITQGLNPHVELKDSGVNWIGGIPKNWRVKKLKYILASPLQYGANESGVEFSDELPRYIRITDISSDNKLKEEGKLSLQNEKAKPYILKNNNILFARSGATVGKTFLYVDEYGLSCFAGYLIRANIDESIASPKYVYYTTLGHGYENWKDMIFSQATIQNIGADKYETYKLPIPTLAEQKQIVDYLDKKCSEIDIIIEGKKQQIESIKKYKNSLIYEYVTGKKRVGQGDVNE